MDTLVRQPATEIHTVSMILPMRDFVFKFCLSLLVVLPVVAQVKAGSVKKPNVIIIITDDQGYGEIGAHGHPVLKTPNLDQLHAESVRLTDFHVDPTCSPTRAALLTGRYSTRTGVWHTINGRSMMRGEELTLPEIFKANGYQTAMIGKWHLGANYPSRPSDQGFDHTILHLDGCIGGGPDYWDNDYFDDTYLKNGEWTKFEGYCTDVWFDEAAKWVEEKKDEPFFLYLSTNAPHGPYFVEEKFSKPYEADGVPEDLAKFYGMIANIDENLGKFRKKLEDLGLAENTLLIFMTDNGTAAGWICMESGFEYYNSGMRGWKGFAWEGGHRVPNFWHWPEGDLTGGRDVEEMTAHFDVLPTLVDMLDLKKPEGPKLDGIPMTGLLQGVEEETFPVRTLFTHVQRANIPPKWEASAAMRGKWRLIDGEKLYDLSNDPGQQKDVASENADIVKELRADYETWWKSLEEDMKQTVRIVLGGKQNPTVLYSHDWLMPTTVVTAWHQNQIRRGDLINGPWNVEVEKAGRYEITLYRWAPYLNKEMEMKEARVEIAGFKESMKLDPKVTEAKFEAKLKEGPTQLMTWLMRPDGGESGAYYTEVRYLGPTTKDD